MAVSTLGTPLRTTSFDRAVPAARVAGAPKSCAHLALRVALRLVGHSPASTRPLQVPAFRLHSHGALHRPAQLDRHPGGLPDVAGTLPRSVGFGRATRRIRPPLPGRLPTAPPRRKWAISRWCHCSFGSPVHKPHQWLHKALASRLAARVLLRPPRAPLQGRGLLCPGTPRPV